MSEESVDCLPLPQISPEAEARLANVQSILECLQSLTDYIASMEHHHIVNNRIHNKNEKHFDLGLIRYQLWLSAASQKITALARELEWKHDEWNSPVEARQLPVESKCILDESLNDGLALPLEPERLWIDPYNARLPPRILTPEEHDPYVFKESRNKTKVTDSENQVDSDEFRKKVERLRCKLAMKEEESYFYPKTYDSTASNVLNNLKSLEDNMSELKQLLNLLEKDIEVSPNKYVAIQNWYVKEVKRMRRLTENLKYEMSSKKDQHNNLKYAVNSQKEEARAKIFYMQPWYEKYLREKCVFQEHKVRALQALTKMKEEADEMCGHIKKQCDGYVATLEASRKRFEDALVQHDAYNKRLHALTQYSKYSKTP